MEGFFPYKLCSVHLTRKKQGRQHGHQGSPAKDTRHHFKFHLSFLHLHLFLSSSPNDLSLASLIFSLMFTTPSFAHISSVLIFSILFVPIIHLNIFVLASFDQFFSVPRSHPHTQVGPTGMIMV